MAIDKEQLKDGKIAIERLEEVMAVFRSMLIAQGAARPLFVQRVPLRNSPDVPAVIDLLKPRSESQAISWAAEALTATRLAGGQHPKESLRCPGVLVVSDEIASFAGKINEAKASLKKVVDDIPPRDRRYLYREFSRFCPTQAMRLIEAHSGLKKVTLRWYEGDGVFRIQAKALREQMLKELSDLMKVNMTARNLTKNTPETVQYQVACDFERLELAGIKDDEVLAVVRPVQPHIRAYLSPEKGMENERWRGRGWYTQAPAPILTTSDVEVNTEKLGKYEPGIGKVTEGGTFEREPLIEKPNVLRYVDSKRSYEAPQKQYTARMRGGNYLDVHLTDT